MKFIYLLLTITFFSFSLIHAQETTPADYFKSPLDVALIPSGTFGELRSNHFHSGIDLKTQGREGLPVYASAEGTVSRIKISHYGYGKALYIKHPNGYSTVYAHLKKFSPEIEAFVKRKQYQKESYEVELFPKPGELYVEQGAVIAYSGNTGGSGGPHLHFEIRDGRSRPMNPMDFGLDVKDSTRPVITGLFAYPQNENSHVNGLNERQELRLIPLKDGNFKTEAIHAMGDVGFGIVSIDRQDLAGNQNGVYRIQTFVNGNQNFQLDFKKFAFSETRHINQLIDYGYYQNNKKRIQKLYVESTNPLSLYQKKINQGIVKLVDSTQCQYAIKVFDYNGNETTIRVPIVVKKEAIKSPKSFTSNYLVTANEPSVFEGNGYDIYIPKNALYKDAHLDIDFSSNLLKFHTDTIPIHKNITIGMDVSSYDANDQQKLYIAKKNYPTADPYYVKTYRKKNRLTAKTRNFGYFLIATDTIAPKIEPVNFENKKWLSNYRYLKLKITDQESGIKSYRATINGRFILTEYDYKKDLLTYDFNDAVVTGTENKLNVVVTDNVGNSTTFERIFYRK
ncbi:M23 family metallopeptidase [Gangjinia marincola]|uniref:M23 family metallopeptidase n=1 Tax=Gangjinia marincola TaxID=578463 RepID=A0ABN1MGY0_9FLAO